MHPAATRRRSVNITLTVPGAPVPMERARRGRHGNWYTPANSLEYRDRIQAAWMMAGRPSFDAQPLSINAQVYVAHPKSHYTTAGDLKPKHELAIPPGDTDNYAKAIADALNQLAYKDDTQITCWAAISKHWTQPGLEHTTIQLWSHA